MIKKLFFLLCISVVVSSCSSSKKVVENSSNKKQVSVADKIVWTAVTYKGTPYKYGGTTDRGMDCSGLIYTSYKQRGVDIPRVSYAMAEEGKRVSLKNVQRGDLLFFKTSKSGKRVNHVGLVTSNDNEIKFIHATSSKGVIVTSLNNPYWNRVFVFAKRVL